MTNEVDYVAQMRRWAADTSGRGPSSVILTGCADYIERLRSLLGKYPERAKLCDDGHPPIIHFDECPICWIDADDLKSSVKSTAPRSRLEEWNAEVDAAKASGGETPNDPL